MSAPQLIVTKNNTHWPVIRFLKDFVSEEKETLKKIIKIALSIILSPIALFLDLTYNVGGFFLSKSINFINSKIKKDEKKQPLGFIEKTKSIWANHKKLIVISFIALGTSITFGYLYYSISPLLAINSKYYNCQKKASSTLNSIRKQHTLTMQTIKRQIEQSSNNARTNKLNQRLLKVNEHTLGELRVAEDIYNKRNANCKNNYNTAFKNLKEKHNSFEILFNLFKLYF